MCVRSADARACQVVSHLCEKTQSQKTTTQAVRARARSQGQHCFAADDDDDKIYPLFLLYFFVPPIFYYLFSPRHHLYAAETHRLSIIRPRTAGACSALTSPLNARAAVEARREPLDLTDFSASLQLSPGVERNCSGLNFAKKS